MLRPEPLTQEAERLQALIEVRERREDEREREDREKEKAPLAPAPREESE